MFIAALFIIARTWKQPRCPSADEWIKKLWYIYIMECSVQFSHSVVSHSLRPHESQHARPPCPWPTPGVYPNSCPSSSWWCHPAISSVIPSPPAPNPSQHQGLFQWVNSYSAIKRNTFESVLMRWMNLEPILQWSESERERYVSYSNIYIWNLERWYWRLYLQGNHGETDIENRLMDMGRGEERVRCMERVTWKLTLPYIK